MAKRKEKKMPATGRRKSGKARMAKLTPSERTELAKKAAERRWEKENAMEKPIRALCGSEESPLMLGGIEIPCYVLEGERRIITLSGLQSALDLNLGGGPGRLAEFIARLDPNHANANELAVRLESPLRFTPPRGGKAAYGYDASLLADLCDALLEARSQDRLSPRYEPFAMRAEILIRAWARVGLDAMIDEVTGFQYFRKRDALADLCRKYISEQLMPWTKTFPDEFYHQIFRLKCWDFSMLKAGDKKPSCVGRYTRNIVYERMPAPIIKQLEKLNPSSGDGTRQHKHHQYLTREIGHPELRVHLEKVVLLMQISVDWDDFRSKLRKVMPKKWEQYELQDLFHDPDDETPPQSDDGLD